MGSPFVGFYNISCFAASFVLRRLFRQFSLLHVSVRACPVVSSMCGCSVNVSVCLCVCVCLWDTVNPTTTNDSERYQLKVPTTSGCEKAFLSLQRRLFLYFFILNVPLDERDGDSGRETERGLSECLWREREGHSSLTG